MTIKDKKELNSCFLLGFLLGILVFIAIYGVAVLNVCADGWIFKSDNDFRQHYIGWMAYRNMEGMLPLGMTDKLSYPYSMSIVYTDSIPLVALCFKAISPLLPATFQFFGWYAMLSFALTAAFGARINYRLLRAGSKADDSKAHLRRMALAVMLSAFYVVSFIMLQRTFYHTSLVSQWIILMCFEMWFSGYMEENIVIQCIKATLLGIVCVGIHTYFLPMAMGILFMGYAEQYLIRSADGGQLSRGNKIEPVRNALASLGMLAVGAAVFLYLMGAFNVNSQGEYWVGDFTMNLATFVNSMGHSILLREIPTYGPMQYEGAAYLGLGLIAGCIILIAYVILKRISIKCLFKGHYRRMSLMITCVLFAVFATSPVIALGDRLLLRIPYTTFMNRALGIFRSNGRFVWPVFYIIIFMLVRAVGAHLNDGFGVKGKSKGVAGNVAIVVAGLLLVLQVVDFSGWIKEKSDKYKDAQATYRTVWDEITLPDDYAHFVVFEKDNSFQMQTAYYAMRHGMDQNNFYFARDIDDYIQAGLAAYKSDISAGAAAEDTIYVFDRETYEEMKNNELHFYMTRKCIFGVKNEIAGMSEVTESDVELVKWQ